LLDPADPRRRQIDELSAMPPGPGKRAAVQSAMAVSYAASDQLHVRVRDFRNILAVSAVLIAVLMGLLTIVVMRFPAAMPLCFAPSSTGPQQAMGVEQVCPSGDGQLPSSGDVIIVVGLGLLGGALAAAFAIRNLRGTSTPYGIPIALAALKVPSGALAAVAGMLLLGGNFVPGLSELDSQRQILAYALLLGFAQQLATRLIDSRAQSLLDSVPSKDPDGKPLMQPVAPRPAVVLRVLEPIHPTGSGALPADPDGAAPVGAASAGAGQPTQAGP
ncbi:MAG: hypothetical protein ACJ73E_00130, partial [Mycobacteriales bacterium]